MAEFIDFFKANVVTFLPTIVALRRWDLTRKVSKDRMVGDLVEFMMRGLGAGDEGRERVELGHGRGAPTLGGR